MGQSIPIGPWPDFETAEAFGGSALKAVADQHGQVITEWAVVQRPDGLWKAEGFCHHLRDLDREGTYVIAGEQGPSASDAAT